MKDAAGKTPLHCAALAGHADIVEILLDFHDSRQVSADLKMPSSNWSMMNDNRMGDLIKGASDSERTPLVDSVNAYGSTPLHRAAFNGRESVVTILLKRGASIGMRGRSGR